MPTTDFIVTDSDWTDTGLSDLEFVLQNFSSDNPDMQAEDHDILVMRLDTTAPAATVYSGFTLFAGAKESWSNANGETIYLRALRPSKGSLLAVVGS